MGLFKPATPSAMPARYNDTASTGQLAGTHVYGWFVVASVQLFAVGVVVHGLGSVLALLATTLGASLAVHGIFSVAGKTSLDSTWWVHGSLLALFLPVALPLPLVAYAAAGGVLLGSLIFGGVGRYLVSPALLGTVLVNVSYPQAYAAANLTVWHETALNGAGRGDWPLWVLQDGAAIGSCSSMLCALAVIVLLYRGVISARVVGGALVGSAALSAWLMAASDAPPLALLLPYDHWTVGLFAPCVVFALCDPTAAATTRPGRWLYGALAGALIVLLRVAGPEHPEASLSACLLAMLAAPLIDQCCQKVMMWRCRRKRLA